MAALSLWVPASIALLLSLPGPWLIQFAPDALAVVLLLVRLCFGRALVLGMLPALLAGQFAGHRLADRLEPERAATEQIVIVSVCGFPGTRGRITRFPARPHEPGLPQQMWVSWFDAPPGLRAGSVWRLRLRIRGARSLHGAGPDRERADFERGVGARASVRRSSANRDVPGVVSRCRLDAARAARAGQVAEVLGERRVMPWVQALALAVRTGLTESDWQLLRATGTSHLVAISGLHIGLVAALAAGLGRGLGLALAWLPRAPPPRTFASLLAVPAALAYSAMAGFATPTLRALTMLCLAIALLSLRRAVRPWRLLAITLVCVLLAQPLSLLAAGFWLSFLAVAALMLPAIALATPAGAWRRTWSAQWRICLCLGPLGLFLFDAVSLSAPVINLLAIPLFAFLVVPAVLAGVLLLPLQAGDWLLQLAAVALDLAIAGLERVAAIPGLLWQPATTSIALVAAGAAALGLAWPRPAPRGSILVLLLAPLMIGWPASETALRVHVVDVGQGLAVLVRTRNHTLLYDTGPAWSGGGSAARSRVLPLLRDLGLGHVDRILVSHSDIDHAGGTALLSATFPRARVLSPQSLPGVTTRDCHAGQSWTWDGVRFTILHPGLRQRRLGASDNDLSCVLLVETTVTRLLLTGDISRRAEAAMLRRYPRGNIDLLLAPHHGSRSSSGPALVDATRPRFVVFAAGYLNRWGFPHAEVVEAWSNVGACLLSSGEHGSLVFSAAANKPLQLTRASRRDARRAWTWGRLPATCDERGAPVK
jgi:competence protein ComEC